MCPELLPTQTVRSAVDSAPHVADKAVTLGLIDGRVHRDQAAKLVVRLHEFKRQQASRCSLVSFFLRSGSLSL